MALSGANKTCPVLMILDDTLENMIIGIHVIGLELTAAHCYCQDLPCTKLDGVVWKPYDETIGGIRYSVLVSGIDHHIIAPAAAFAAQALVGASVPEAQCQEDA